VHSQGAQIPSILAQDEPVLWVHPSDADARGIKDGRPVLISSPEGRVRVPAKVTEDIMPGAVCLIEGVWPSFDAGGVDTAGSANVLTSTTPSEPSLGSRTHSVLVEISPV
jgi:anaerobic dimethyl sulfoxide reductase subunit A